MYSFDRLTDSRTNYGLRHCKSSIPLRISPYVPRIRILIFVQSRKTAEARLRTRKFHFLFARAVRTHSLVVSRFASDYNAPHAVSFRMRLRRAYATCPGSHDNDSHIRYSSLVCRLTAVERDTVLRFFVYIMLV